MGATAIPAGLPRQRLKALTCKSLPNDGTIEAVEYCFLEDSQEWVVDNSEDRQAILEVYPDAHFFKLNPDLSS